MRGGNEIVSLARELFLSFDTNTESTSTDKCREDERETVEAVSEADELLWPDIWL